MPALLRSAVVLLCCLGPLSVSTKAGAQTGAPAARPADAGRRCTGETAAGWRGFSLSAGAPARLLRERDREAFRERRNFKAAYVHPLGARLGVSIAYEEYRFAADLGELAERYRFRDVVMPGGASRIRALSLAAEFSGVEVATVSPYVFGGPALVAYRNEPFRLTEPPYEAVRPGSSPVRPGGSIGAGARVPLAGGVHGLAEGSFLAGFHPDGALLAGLRAGVAYAF
jgi:hypothetical protein